MSGEPITLLKYLRKIQKLQEGNNSTEPGAIGKIANSTELKTLNQADDLEGDLSNLDVVIEEFEEKWVSLQGAIDKQDKDIYVFNGPDGQAKTTLVNLYNQYFGGESSLLQIKINAYNTVANTNFQNDTEVQFTDSSKTLVPLNNTTDGLTVSVKDFKTKRDTISEKIGTKLTDLKEAFTNKANDLVIEELGFKPTIRSFFAVLLANTELFLELLLDVSREAEKYHSEGGGKDHKMFRVKDVEEPVNKIAYAWPTYYEIEDSKTNTGQKNLIQVEKYPGTNPKFRSWPEVKFVEEFIKALIKMQKAINEEDGGGGSEYTGIPGRDNYVPINAMETPLIVDDCSNSYFGLLDLPSVYKAIGERFITLTNMTSVNSNFLNSSILLSARNKYQHRINAGYFKNEDGYSFTHLEKVVKGEHSPYFSFGIPFNPVKFGGEDKSSEEGKTYTGSFKEIEGVIGYPAILHEPTDYNSVVLKGVVRNPVGVNESNGDKPPAGNTKEDFPPCVRRFGDPVKGSNGDYYVIKGVTGDYPNYVFYKNYTVFVPTTSNLSGVNKGKNNDYKCSGDTIVINQGKGEIQTKDAPVDEEKTNPGVFWTVNLSEKVKENMYDFGKIEAYNIMASIENTDLLNSLVSSFPDKNEAFSKIVIDGLGYSFESEDFSSDDRNSAFRYNKEITLNHASATKTILKPDIHNMDINSLIQLKPCEDCIKAGQPGQQITGYRTFKLTEDNPAVLDKTLDSLFGSYGLIPSEQKWKDDNGFEINNDLNLAQDVLPNITTNNNPGKSSGYFIKPQKPIFEYQSGVADGSTTLDGRYTRSSIFSQVNYDILDSMMELNIYPDYEFYYQKGWSKFKGYRKVDMYGDYNYRYSFGVMEYTYNSRSIEAKYGKNRIKAGWYIVLPSFNQGGSGVRKWFNYNRNLGTFIESNNEGARPQFGETTNKQKIIDYSPGSYNKIYSRNKEISLIKEADGTATQKELGVKEFEIKIKDNKVVSSTLGKLGENSNTDTYYLYNSNTSEDGNTNFKLNGLFYKKNEIELTKPDTSTADNWYLNDEVEFVLWISNTDIDGKPTKIKWELLQINGDIEERIPFRYKLIKDGKESSIKTIKGSDNFIIETLQPKERVGIKFVFDSILYDAQNGTPASLLGIGELGATEYGGWDTMLGFKITNTGFSREIRLKLEKDNGQTIPKHFKFLFYGQTPKKLQNNNTDEDVTLGTDNEYKLQIGSHNINYLNQGAILTESPFWRHNFPSEESESETTDSFYYSFFGAPYFSSKVNKIDQIQNKRFLMGVKSDLDGGKIGGYIGLKPKDGKIFTPDNNVGSTQKINILTTHNKKDFNLIPNNDGTTYTLGKEVPNLNRTKAWKGALAYLFLANQYHRPWTGMYTNNDTFYGPQSILGTASQSTVIPNHSVYLLGAVLWRMREAGLFISDEERWNMEPENSFIGDDYIDPLNVPLLPKNIRFKELQNLNNQNVRFYFNTEIFKVTYSDTETDPNYEWNNGVRPPMASFITHINQFKRDRKSLNTLICFPRADEWPTPNNGMIYAHSLKNGSERVNPFKNQYDIYAPVLSGKGTLALRFGNQNVRWLPNEEALTNFQNSINEFYGDVADDLAWYGSTYKEEKKKELDQKAGDILKKELENSYILENIVKSKSSFAGKDESYNKFTAIAHNIDLLKGDLLDGDQENGRNKVGPTYNTSGNDNWVQVTLYYYEDLKKILDEKKYNGQEIERIEDEWVIDEYKDKDGSYIIESENIGNWFTKWHDVDVKGCDKKFTVDYPDNFLEDPDDYGTAFTWVAMPYGKVNNFNIKRYDPKNGCRRPFRAPGIDDNVQLVPKTPLYRIQRKQVIGKSGTVKKVNNTEYRRKKGRMFNLLLKKAKSRKAAWEGKNSNELGYLRGYLPIGPELWFLPKEVKKLFIDKFLEFVGNLNNYNGDSDFDNILTVVDPLNFPKNKGFKYDGSKEELKGNVVPKKIESLYGKKGMPNVSENAVISESLFNWVKTYNVIPNKKSIEINNKLENVNTVENPLNANNENVQLIYKKLFNDGFILTQATPRIWWAEYPTTVLDDRSKGQQEREYEPFKYFYFSEQELKAFCDGIVSAIKSKAGKDVITGKNTIGQGGSQDDDLRLSTYRSLKSIYDKWISGSDVAEEPGVTDKKTEDQTETTNMFYNPIGKGRLLIEHFSFVNRVNVDIGDKAILNIEEMASLINNTTMSVFGVSSDVLDKSNFLFHPLPAYYDLGVRGPNVKGNVEIDDDLANKLKDMFSPLADVGILQSTNRGPHFLCMYVGGTSKELALATRKEDSRCLTAYNNNGDFKYEREGDGNSLGGNDVNNTSVDFDATDSYGVVGFKVKFASQNQSHFTNIQLDQSEFKNTQESLQTLEIISQAGDTSNGNGFVAKGQSLYEVYLNRSYSCTVEGLGNMMIQPLQYFELENVPMFYGSYLIRDVKHSVTPNHVRTTFTGDRIPQAQVPLVEDIVSAFNLAPSDGSSGNLLTNNNNNNCLLEVDTSDIPEGDDPAPIVNPNKIGIQLADQTPSYKKSGINTRPMTKEQVLQLVTEGKLVQIGDGKVDSKHFVGVNQGLESVTLLDGKFYLAKDAAEAFKKWFDDMVAAGINFKVSSALRYGKNVGGGPHGYGVAIDFNNLYQDVNGAQTGSANKAARISSPTYKQMVKLGAKYDWYNPWRLSDGSGQDELWHFEYWGPLSEVILEDTSNGNCNPESNTNPPNGSGLKIDGLESGFGGKLKKIIVNGKYGGITISDYENDWLAISANYIAGKESFTAKPGNDEGTLRAGYGTDKILINGNLEKVTSSTVFTEQTAKDTIVYQIKNTYAKQIEKDLGSENWNKLNKYQKVGLVSLGYNVGAYYISAREYGKQIKKAIQDNNYKDAAQGILNGPTTGAQSKKVYPGLVKRRQDEARFFLLDNNYKLTYVNP